MQCVPGEHAQTWSSLCWPSARARVRLVLTGSAQKIKCLFLSLTCPESHLLTYPFRKTEYGKSSPRKTERVEKEQRHPVRRAGAPWVLCPVPGAGGCSGPEQGTGGSCPALGGTGCARWAQPGADTGPGTEPRREELLWGSLLLPPALLLAVCGKYRHQL